MTRTELEAKRSMLRRELQPLEKVTFSCHHCENYSPSSRVCSVFDETPPPEAITNDIGCEAWIFDGIPW